MHPQKFSPKYIFISGGVISGLGKGITTASIGLLLKSAGFKVSAMKADMYLNIDAGTMNPDEKKTCSVLDLQSLLTWFTARFCNCS